MDQATILNLMKSYFQKAKPKEDMSNFSEKPMSALLKDSLDTVEFSMYLEDGLGLNQEIDLNQLGPKLMNKTFGELAKEVESFLFGESRLSS